jgi:hypothetical protein
MPAANTSGTDSRQSLRPFEGIAAVVADELRKRSQALLARDARREVQLGALEQEIAALQIGVEDRVRTLAAAPLHDA